MGSIPDHDGHSDQSDHSDHKIHTNHHQPLTRKKRSTSRHSGIWPSRVVWTQTTHAPPGTVEVGLIVAAMILLLYSFAFYETLVSLPDVPQTPNWKHHMGQVWNLPIGFHDERPNAKTSTHEQQSPKQLQGHKDIHSNDIKNELLTANHIPKGVWPVTLRDEGDKYVQIVHPGDNTTPMMVPPFWSRPVHNKKLMTRETAMQIGTCTEPDENGNYARGDACPVDLRTIFVAIASYRDFECRTTVEDVFNRAKNPDRIRVAVVDQIVHGEDPRCDEPIQPCDQDPQQALCRYRDRIDVYEMEAALSVGPVFARHIGSRMYRGEYYATQSDAHVSFTQNWDASIISQLDATHNEMAILTTYLTDVQGSIDAQGNSLRKTRPIMCNTFYEGGAQGMHLRHGAQPERLPAIRGIPQLQPWWAAGYSFSRGHFVVNSPYDLYQQMIFQGEEMSIGIRAWTMGYDMYAPEFSVCFHHYAVGENAKIRNKVHHFWENDQKYAGTGKRAMARLLGIVHMNPEVDPSTWDHRDEDWYGIGGVRTPEKFYELFGIDVIRKTVERHLCDFVHERANMHTMLQPHLRSDGMGIDYTLVNYKFKDPRPDEK